MTFMIKKKPASAPNMTLADGIQLLEKLPSKTPRQQASRAEVISAFRRVAVIAGRTPEDVPATPAAVDKLLAGINPVLADLSTGGFYNLKSRLRRGFRLLGLITTQVAKVALTPAWQKLTYALPKDHRIKLGRFGRYCCRKGISPCSVTEAVFAEFYQELIANAIAHNALTAAQAAAFGWNYGHRHVVEWPDLTLVCPSKAKPTFVRPLGFFPQGLLLDYDVWLTRVRDADEGDVHAPSKPYRPATIDIRTFYCRYVASTLVEMGMPVHEIVSLATLLKPASIDKTLKFVEQRLGKDNSPQMMGILTALLGFAKYGPPACRKYADAIQNRLKKAEQKFGRKRMGMTERNRRRVTAFSDPATVRRLLNLPVVLMKKADAVKAPHAETARQAMIAVAVEILFANPMRAENLYGLDLDRHFQHIGHGKAARTVVHVDGQEVKNSIDIDFGLPNTARALIRHFVVKYRPILLERHGQPDGTQYLFPGTEDGHLCHRNAWDLLGTVTERFVGVRLSTHHFRHVLAYLLLARNPGAYELVAKVLGHADATTTKRFYTGVEHLVAIEHFQQIIRTSGAFGKPMGKKPTTDVL